MTGDRVAFFPSAFHPHIGGVEELTLRLALTQQQEGRTPTVVTMREPKHLPAVERVEGVEVLRYRWRVPEPHPRFLAGWALHARRLRQDVVAALRARRCDLVHVQCVSGQARYAQAAARDLGVPLVVTLQGEIGMDATGLYQRSTQTRRAWRRLIDAADAVTGCSQFVLDEAAELYGGPLPGTPTVIPNGIDYALCAAAVPERRPRPYVLGLGRLVPQKGYHLLVDAFGQLVTEMPDHELVIAGDGPQRPALARQAASLGLDGRVTFLGSVTHDRALALYAGSDAFILASPREPQGIVLLEAMAAGAPVVAAAGGGVPETVRDSENGWLFPPDSSAALAVAVMKAVTAGRGPTHDSATAVAQAHNWSVLSARYQSVYADAVDHRRPPP